ncbi:MAG: HlyC/CorC family transporter [Saprospiraceae bacterium]|nr:HlyC/CorC family transporter [Candidatus Defluviibacterium haderslevense]
MLIFWILFFLLLSAFFSGTETAFFTANKLNIEIKKSRGSNSAHIIHHFFERPDDFIAVNQVGNNIALVTLSYLLANFFGPYLDFFSIEDGTKVVLSTILVTITILIIGEFLPKVLFRLYANELILIMAYPILFFNKILYVPAKTFSIISHFLIRKFISSAPDKVRYRFSNLDLEHYIDGSMKLSNDEIDADIFKNTLNLKQVRAKECMIPRNEIVHIDVNDTREDLVRLFADSNLSRIIVTEEDIDNVLGYIHHQQMFKDNKNIREMIMEMPYVPETLNVYDLMVRMNKLRLSIACVVDEFGGTSGIITFEDILEEIFGEIDDEHDKEDFIEQEISKNEYLFSGRLEINYLNNTYHLNLPEGEYHTLSGYLVTAAGIIPAQGIELFLDGYQFIFELVSDTKIETVRVIRLV